MKQKAELNTGYSFTCGSRRKMLNWDYVGGQRDERLALLGGGVVTKCDNI